MLTMCGQQCEGYTGLGLNRAVQNRGRLQEFPTVSKLLVFTNMYLPASECELVWGMLTDQAVTHRMGGKGRGACSAVILILSLDLLVQVLLPPLPHNALQGLL